MTIPEAQAAIAKIRDDGTPTLLQIGRDYYEITDELDDTEIHAIAAQVAVAGDFFTDCFIFTLTGVLGEDH
jgi:hypothetical protein